MSVLIEKSLKTKFIVFAVGCAGILPLAWLLIQSFAQNWRFPLIFPPEFSFRAWSYLLDSSSGVSQALLSSLLIAFIVTFLSLCLAIPAARAIGLYDFRGKSLVLFALLLPILSPAIATAVGGHALFLRYNLTDSWTGVILAHLVPTMPYCILTLTGSFARFDTDFEAQAKNLGASNLQIWRYVILPAIAPGVALAAVFAFLISWSQYLTTLLIGGGKVITLPLILVNFQRSSDEAVTSGLTLIFLVPTIVFLAISTRFWRN